MECRAWLLPDIMLLIQFVHICPQRILLVYLHDLEQTVDRQQCEGQWLPPCNSAVHTIVVQCSPNGGLMNIAISCYKRGL